MLPSTLDRARAALGDDGVRAPTEADAIDEVRPTAVVEPADESGVAAALAWASREELAVVPAGGGTKLGWGPPPARLDVLLSLARLNRVIAHRHGDLTATLEAGVPLAAANAALARHAQRIPLDPPAAGRATLGGIVATNDSGPLRHQHGTPRDLLIGASFVTGDGRAAKAGGIVVKNVAGYDLGKLLAGSFGSLAVLTSVTVKLAPAPAASRTVEAGVRDAATLASVVRDLMSSPLTPAAVEIAGPPWRLLVRYESVEVAARGQAEATLRLIGRRAADNRVLDGSEETTCWSDHAARPWTGGGVIARVSVLPADLAPTLGFLADAASREGLVWEVAGRAGCGVLLVRLEGEGARIAGVVEGLRRRFPEGCGSAVLVRAPAALRRSLDVWGPIGSSLGVMRAIKTRLDPGGVLSPGRGPGGL